MERRINVFGDGVTPISIWTLKQPSEKLVIALNVKPSCIYLKKNRSRTLFMQNIWQNRCLWGSKWKGKR